MDEFKLYSVSDEYVGWLRKNDPNVYSNKVDTRKHTRKYLDREEVAKSLVGVLPKEVDIDMARDERLGVKQMDRAVAINILKNELEKAEASILEEGTVSADELERELDVDK